MAFNMLKWMGVRPRGPDPAEIAERERLKARKERERAIFDKLVDLVARDVASRPGFVLPDKGVVRWYHQWGIPDRGDLNVVLWRADTNEWLGEATYDNGVYLLIRRERVEPDLCTNLFKEETP